jgi:hypothetical protein
MILSILLALAPDQTIVAPAPQPAPPKVVRMVEIGKAKFKVRLRGDAAEVSRTNFTFNANAQHYQMVKQAAELASGCKAVQFFTPSGIFVNPVSVLLDCSEKTAPAKP